jgi:ribosomal protein L30/L7E
MANAARLAPSERPAARARTGDLLAQLVRSASGRPPAVTDTLRTLGLARKIGRCTVVDSRVTAAAASLQLVRHLVAVKPLTLGASRLLESEPEAGDMERLVYAIGEREARRYEIDEDNFLAIELYEDSFSLRWSTYLTVGSVLGQLAGRLPEARADDLAVIFDPILKLHLEVPATDTIQDLRKHERAYPLVVINLGSLSLGWRTPQYPAHVDEAVVAGDLAISSRSFDPDYYAELIELTATPAIALQARELMEEVAYISLHLEADPPSTAR